MTIQTTKNFKQLLDDFGLLSREPEACEELMEMFDNNHDAAINAAWRLYDRVYLEK